jgi:ubiquinone/menaquinone biosynthesis C-methylase UbiE
MYFISIFIFQLWRGILSLEKLKEIYLSNRYTIDATFIYETIKKLHLDVDSKILDIGTGYGTMACILAIIGFNVLTGQPKELEHPPWEEYAKAVGVDDKIEYQHIKAEKLPFPSESFDGIFMLITLPYIQNKKVALNECLRVIKPKGLIVSIEDNESGIEYFQKKGMSAGVVPYPLDPRELIPRDDVSTELIAGKYVNFFILRKR